MERICVCSLEQVDAASLSRQGVEEGLGKRGLFRIRVVFDVGKGDLFRVRKIRGGFSGFSDGGSSVGLGRTSS